MRVSPRSKAREKVLERRAKKARKIIINKFKMFAVKKILYDGIVLARTSITETTHEPVTSAFVYTQTHICVESNIGHQPMRVCVSVINHDVSHHQPVDVGVSVFGS